MNPTVGPIGATQIPVARTPLVTSPQPEVGPLFHPQQCLRLRSRFSNCERCAAACPAHVLRMTGDALELAGDCLRCGQCSAACPTGALRLEGFEPDLSRFATRSDSPHHLDCWKVPALEAPQGTTRVPCLGGIAAHHLVQWHVALGFRPLVLLDRGWCAKCPAGGGANHPAEAALHSARSVLTELGVPKPSLPRVERRPLPFAQMATGIPEPLGEQRLGRREFFGGLARGAARTVMQVATRHQTATAKAPALREKLTATGRTRLLEAAVTVAARHARALPVSLFPALTVSDRCRNHQVCSAACPTGALRRYETVDTKTAGVAFNAAACIGCGDCERACPEQALTLSPAGGSAAEDPPPLTAWRLRECYDCGHEFADSGSGNLCPPCRKTRDLTRASFTRLFGPGGRPAERERLE